MSGHWRVVIAGYALADGLYWVAVKPRLRRSLGLRAAQATGACL